MKLLITGSSGYIGTHLIRLANIRKHEVVIAARQSVTATSLYIPFDINTSSKLNIPKNTDAIIHLAANTTLSGNNAIQREISAANLLIHAAKKANAKIIFVSSQTSQENSPTAYGRTKWYIEKEILAARGVVVRLGQVYGGSEQGLFGTLVRFVRYFPVLPAFVPSPLIQPIHVDDCAIGLLKLVEHNELASGIYSLASTHPVSFTDFLKAIGKYRVRRRKIFLPIPVSVAALFINFLGTKLSTKLSLNRLTALFNLPLMYTTNDLNLIKLRLRTLQMGMNHPTGYLRRKLIREGFGLLTYILRDKPNPALVRRYVYIIEKLRGGSPLAIPSWLFLWPAFLTLLDRSTPTSQLKNEFSWRIDATTVIAEASKQGAKRFLSITHQSMLITLVRIILILISGFLWHLIAFPFLSFPFLTQVYKNRDL